MAPPDSNIGDPSSDSDGPKSLSPLRSRNKLRYNDAENKGSVVGGNYEDCRPQRGPVAPFVIPQVVMMDIFAANYL